MTGMPLPEARGRLMRSAALAPLTWFRAGGCADALFLPRDAEDLSRFLAALAPGVPVLPIGVASNLLVRDGGVRGVAVRLGARFAGIELADGCRIRAGAGALAARVAAFAAEHDVAGLEFLRGIPGTVGGALAMNAAAFGGGVSDVLSSCDALGRGGERRRLRPGDMGFGYRRCGVAPDVIFLAAEFAGRSGRRADITARMESLVARREASQPVRSRTGGSTFKNPGGRPGENGGCSDWRDSAWRLIDAAGCRGRRRGDAAVSEKHANFLVNLGSATATDIEGLGEEVRDRVRSRFGVRLEWEIRRVGERLSDGR